MTDISTIIAATIQHLTLTYASLAISIIIGIPLAIVSIYNKKLSSFINALANLVQAVPSFAVVAIVVPLLGIGFTPAIIAIMLRSLLPIVKNTNIGLSDIDKSLIDAAEGIGLTKWQIIKKIRFPNAYPSMFAGIKFAAILANSVAIITAIIGSGGLGTLVFLGLASLNMKNLLAGSLPAIGIAIFIDISFSWIENRIRPTNLE
ncbi:MAG: ABC transporter permease [Candidatus Methanofastidiosum sp.]|nr:ABC transporter permease [Methanofastidiosum sp.]